MTFLTVNII